MYPFRFYGVRPVEWFEGANEGHAYDLTFCESPSVEQRQALAEAYEQITRKGAATGAPSKPWRWSGRSARLHLGERKSNDHAKYFKAAQRVMSALHRACALESVLFCGSWGDPIGTDAWDEWSLAQATPDPVLFTPTSPGTVDAAFERARRVARLGREVVEAEEAEVEAAVASGALALVPTSAPAEAPTIPAEIVERFGLTIAHYAYASASGRILARGSRFGSVAWLDDAGEVRGWGTEKLAEAWPKVSPDGERVLVVLDGDTHRLVQVSVADGSSEELWVGTADEPGVGAVCPVADDRVVCITRAGLVLLERSEQGWSVADRYHPGPGTRGGGMLFVVHGGRVLVYVAADHVRVLRIDQHQLDEFGRIVPPTPRRLTKPWTDGVRLTGIDWKTNAPIELVNVERCWRERWGDPPWEGPGESDGARVGARH